jgi:hypothetical protein
LFETIRQTLDGHIMTPSVEDAESVDRHFRFLVRQLVLGIVGLSAFPIWLALGAPGSVFATMAFFWLLAPLAIAAFVLRTNRLAAGQRLATVALTGLLVWVCAMTGGLGSPLILLFVVVTLTAFSENPSQSLKLPVAAAIAGIGVTAILDLNGTVAANSAFSVIGFAVSILSVIGVAVWADRTARGGNRAAGGVAPQPFIQAGTPYNQEDRGPGLLPAPVGFSIAPTGNDFGFDQAEPIGRVVPLGLKAAMPDPVGGDRHIQETSAREVRNSA